MSVFQKVKDFLEHTFLYFSFFLDYFFVFDYYWICKAFDVGCAVADIFQFQGGRNTGGNSDYRLQYRICGKIFN